MEVVVRVFDPETDRSAAEAVDRICDAGTSGKMSLVTHHHGDPVSRVRNSPAFLMLVAEIEKDMVGLVRGCVKTVTCGKKLHRSSNSDTATPIYTKLGYILGLRVSPSHRRMGIGLQLVLQMEEWFRTMGAEYSYMATDIDNKASISLFTGCCGYSKFRTPAILVHPVFAHSLPIPRRTIVLRLPAADAELLYRRRLSTVEFFPRDIDAVLNNPLTIGTFLSLPKDYIFRDVASFLADPPSSWAVASVWDCKPVFKLEVQGASRLRRGLAAATRAADKAMPWLRIPSVPDIFRPFGVYFMYGVAGEGAAAEGMVRTLCRHAHNMAAVCGGGVLAAEVAGCDPLRLGIPHWRRLSLEEDLWCVKRLADDYSAVGDWTKSSPGTSIFVDPREI